MRTLKKMFICIANEKTVFFPSKEIYFHTYEIFLRLSEKCWWWNKFIQIFINSLFLTCIFKYILYKSWFLQSSFPYSDCSLVIVSLFVSFRQSQRCAGIRQVGLSEVGFGQGLSGSTGRPMLGYPKSSKYPTFPGIPTFSGFQDFRGIGNE